MNNDNDNIENSNVPNDDSVVNPLLNLSTPSDEQQISNATPEAPSEPALDDILNNVSVDANNQEQVSQASMPEVDTSSASTMPGLEDAASESIMPGLDNTTPESTMPGLDNDTSVSQNEDLNIDTQNTIPGAEFDNGFLPGLNDNINSDIMNGFDNMSAQSPIDMNQSNIDFNQAQDFNNMAPDMNQAQDFNNMAPDMNQAQDFNNMAPDMNQAQGFNNMEPDMGVSAGQYGVNPNSYANTQYATDYNEGFIQTWMGSELYQKSTTKKFNWCAALFGPAYLFFRKMYLTAALAFLIQAIISLICALLNAPIAVTFIVSFIIFIAYFVGLGMGFYPIYKSYIQKQMEKYRRQVPDNNQLLNVASQKGGTSILALIIYLVVSSLVVSGIMGMSLYNGAKNIASSMTTNTTNQVEPKKVTDVFNFSDSYYITYDTGTWFLDEDEKTLEKGDYKLAYATSYNESALGVNLSTSDGRASILKQLVDQFTSLATQANLQVANTSNSFISQNNCYYTYMDISSDTATSRYYFIILPDDKVLFQFALGIEDTSIAYETHMETITMLTQIDKDDSFIEDNESNTIANETSNSINSNEISNSITNETTSDGPVPRPAQSSNSTANNTNNTNSTNNV